MIEVEMNSFRRLKEALVKPPVLFLPRYDLTCVLDTNAWDKQLGTVLMQRYDDKSLRTTGFYYHTLTVAKRNYDMTELECIAIVWAVILPRPYIYDTKFEIQTRRDSLRWILHLDTPSGWLAYWKLSPQILFRSCTKPRYKEPCPNGLSRLDNDGHDETETDDKIPVLELIKVVTKKIHKFNEDDQVSQKAAPYPDFKQTKTLFHARHS